MNPVLIIRTDVFSTFVALFFIAYDRYCAKYRSGKTYFTGLAVTCLGHDIMALVTELTVNSETVPKWLNDGAHILFFGFSVLFSVMFFQYALSLVLRKEALKRYRIASYILFVILMGVLIVSPIDYLQGNGTKYSAGIGPTICYMTGFILFFCADVIVLIMRKRISDAVFYSLLPISNVALIFLVVQILVPEFLFTGAALTMMTIGLFCATENPIAKLQKSAFIDEGTQLWNRSCYERDLDGEIPARVEAGSDLICVIGDINGLKNVNDALGHQTGDQLINQTVQVLNETMYHAYRIYRIGGDEFAMLFLDKDPKLVKEAMALATERCSTFRFGEGLPVGISLGMARKEKGEAISETLDRADREMYEAKRAYYRDHNIERRQNP